MNYRTALAVAALAAAIAPLCAQAQKKPRTAWGDPDLTGAYSEFTTAPLDSWMGWSNGHWDGDTFVVEVTGLNGLTWLDRAGNYASGSAHITERYTPLGPNHLQYEATIEDPTVFSRAWTISLPLYRRIETNAQLVEFRCIEFVEEKLYGQYRKVEAE